MTQPGYDFDTLPGRSHSGAAKFADMRRRNPDVPPGIVPFSVADMELRTAPEIVDGLREFVDSDVLGYADSSREYDEAVAGWLRRRHGWEIDPDWNVVYQGVVPALFAAVGAYTEPGDGVALMPPVYRPFFSAVQTLGRRVVEVPLIGEGGTYRMDLDLFRRKTAEKDVKLVLLCSPHNPVSRVWSAEELRAFGRIARENAVLVVSDEIHFDIVMPGRGHVVFPTLDPDFAGNCVVCTAPSKTFNLAGLQASNIVIPDARLRERFVAVKREAGLRSLGALAYHATRIAYTRGEAWLEALLGHVAGNERLVRNFFAQRFPEVKITPLEGTYLLWLDFRAWNMGGKELEAFMERQALLFFGEGYAFGTGGAGFERLNLACPSRTLIQALERLLAARENRDRLPRRAEGGVQA
ncbi:MAG: pyridoxal phosphate-dependent aminotransferase [Planctomycetota bacterium]|jgi:putative C-S lyase|nr:pyridoxal phosphate-dependent aminotransferase [Planctomycetota bacterium]